MAEARRRKPHARNHSRDCIQRRDQTNSKCRLITPSPTFGHSSESIDEQSIWSFYKRILTSALDRIEQWLLSKENDDHGLTAGKSRAWSTGLFRFCISAAFTYPLLSGMLHWFIADEFWLTSIKILNKAIGFEDKLVFIVGCLVLFWPWPIYAAAAQRSKWIPSGQNNAIEISIRVAAAVCLYFANMGFAGGSLLAAAQGGSFETGSMMTVGSTKPILLICFGLMCLSWRHPITAVLVGHCTAILFAGLFYENLATFNAFFLIMCVIAWGVMYSFIPSLTSKRNWLLICVPFISLLFWSIFLAYGLDAETPNEGQTLGRAFWNTTEGRAVVLYAMVFPSINLYFDFLSIGVTIYLLRKTIETSIAFAFIDILVALALLAGISISFVLYIHYARTDQYMLVSLTSIFQQAVYGEYQNIWYLGLFVFSTLFPSLVHMIIAVGVFLMAWPRRIRLLITDFFLGDEIAVVLGWAILTAWMLFGFSCVLGVLILLLSYFEPFAYWFVWQLIFFADFIGAVQVGSG